VPEPPPPPPLRAAAAAGAPPPPPPPPLDATYAEFFAEPPPDPAHCLGAGGGFPAAPAGPATGRAYVAPNCGGGIGNQVFCAAAALSYALEHDRCLLLARIQYHPSSARAVSYRDTVFRHFWLQEALPGGGLDGAAAAGGAVAQPGSSMHWSPWAAPRAARPWLAVLLGGWQHFWYTWRHRAALARYLRPAPAAVRDLLRRYPDLPRAAALHFRRGDFVHSLPQYRHVARDFPVPSVFYYRAALGALLADAAARPGAGGAPRAFFVFTDDYAWARNQSWLLAALPGRVVWPEAEDEVSSWYMMMLARRGVICANSTFCWWAAYLGAAARVFLPSHWYNSPGHEPTGIHFPGATVVHSDNEAGEGPPPWFPNSINSPRALVPASFLSS